MISIPLYIPHLLFNWNFGSEICIFWLIVDYLLCTASVYNIVLISYDRYQSVSNAVSYKVNSFSLEEYIVGNSGSLSHAYISVLGILGMNSRDLNKFEALCPFDNWPRVLTGFYSV